MSLNLFRDLSWLPQPPPDFNERCRAAPAGGGETGRRLQELASFALDETQLNRLAKVISKAVASHSVLKPLIPFRLGVLCNSTVDFIVPSIVGTAARHGLALECIKADYDQVMQEALSPVSAINLSKPDAVLVAIDYRALPLHSKPASAKEAQNSVQQALDFIETVRAGLKTNSKAVCILQTIAPPAERLFGSLDRVLPGALRNMIDRVNLGISESVLGTDDILLDVAGLAETVGL
jgi:predicted enzyme involved in methoxymalonyl-ACP biosynthesis